MGHRVDPAMVRRNVELVGLFGTVQADRAAVLRLLRRNDLEYETDYVDAINGDARLSATLDFFIAHGATRRYGFLQAADLMAHLRAAEPTIVASLAAVQDYAALARLADRSTMTVAEVETVLSWKPNLTIGPRVRIRRVGELGQICHHYAFGGLQGDDPTSFNMANLAATLQAPMMTYEEYEESQADPLPQEQYESMPFLQLPNLSGLAGTTVDIHDLVAGVDDGGPFPVRLYDDVAHSARQEAGRWWHKLSDLPFLVAIDGNENLGYPLTAQFDVRSAATDGTVGSFQVTD